MTPYQRRRIIVGVVLVAVVAAGIAAAALSGDGGTARTSADVFYEGKGELGRDPFTTAAVSRCPAGTEEGPQGRLDECLLEGSSTSGAVEGGSTTRVCDADGLVGAFADDQRGAQAWAEVLEADPTLRWTGDHPLTAADLPAYVGELTASALTRDTRATNYGFQEAKTRARQSLLQAGTAVLVDAAGVARVRCLGGTPLTAPRQIDDPNYRGTCWDGCEHQPYCTGSGCAGTPVSSSSSSTSTTACAVTTTTDADGISLCPPPPGATTTTTARGGGRDTDPKATTSRPPKVTTARPPRTTTTRPPTTTTLPPTTTTNPPRTTTTNAP